MKGGNEIQVEEKINRREKEMEGGEEMTEDEGVRILKYGA